MVPKANEKLKKLQERMKGQEATKEKQQKYDRFERLIADRDNAALRDTGGRVLKKRELSDFLEQYFRERLEMSKEEIASAISDLNRLFSERTPIYHDKEAGSLSSEEVKEKYAQVNERIMRKLGEITEEVSGRKKQSNPGTSAYAGGSTSDNSSRTVDEDSKLENQHTERMDEEIERLLNDSESNEVIEVPYNPQEITPESFRDLLSEEKGIQALKELIATRSDEIDRLFKRKGIDKKELERMSRDDERLSDIHWKLYQEEKRVIREYLNRVEKSRGDLGDVIRNSFFEQWKTLFEHSDHIFNIINTYKQEAEEASPETPNKDDTKTEASRPVQSDEEEKSERTNLQEAIKSAKNEMVHAQEDYERALENHYEKEHAKNFVVRGAKYAASIFGGGNVPPDVDEFERRYVAARRKHAQSISDALDYRREHGGEGVGVKFHFENENIKRSAAKRYILEAIERRREIRDKIFIPNETETWVRAKLRQLNKHKWETRLFRVGVYALVGGLTGGTVSAALLAASHKTAGMAGGIAGGVAAGKKWWSIYDKKIQRQQNVIAEKVQDTEKGFSVQNIGTDERALIKEQERVERQQKRQKTGSLAAAVAVGAATGAATSDVFDAWSGAHEAMPLEHPHESSSAVTDRGVSSEATSHPSSGGVGKEPESATGGQQDSGTNSRDGLIDEDKLHPEESAVGSGVSEQQNSHTGSGIEEKLVEGSSIGAALGGIESVPHVDIYEVQQGDNLWHIMNGQVEDRGMSEVLKQIPEAHRDAALDELFDKVDHDASLREAIGMHSDNADKIYYDMDGKGTGEQLHIDVLDKVLHDIAVEHHYISDATGQHDAVAQTEVHGPYDATERTQAESPIHTLSNEAHRLSADQPDPDDGLRGVDGPHPGIGIENLPHDTGHDEAPGGVRVPGAENVPHPETEDIEPQDSMPSSEQFHQDEEGYPLGKQPVPDVHQNMPEYILTDLKNSFIEENLGKSEPGGLFGLIPASPNAYDFLKDMPMRQIQSLAEGKQYVGAGIPDDQWVRFSDMVRKMEVAAKVRPEETLAEYVGRYIETAPEFVAANDDIGAGRLVA